MKKILFAMLTSIAIFTVACNEEDKKESQKAIDGYFTYTSDSLGLELKYPETFTPIDYLKPVIPISFFELTPDSTNYLLLPNMSLNFQQIPAVQISLTEYLQGSKTGLDLEMKSINPDFKTFDIDSFEHEGLKVGFFKYEAPKSADTVFMSKMYFIMQPQRVIAINCTSLKDKFPQYESVYDTFVKSIKLKKTN